jgi:hypothetical protein
MKRIMFYTLPILVLFAFASSRADTINSSNANSATVATQAAPAAQNTNAPGVPPNSNIKPPVINGNPPVNNQAMPSTSASTDSSFHKNSNGNDD